MGMTPLSEARAADQECQVVCVHGGGVCRKGKKSKSKFVFIFSFAYSQHS